MGRIDNLISNYKEGLIGENQDGDYEPGGKEGSNDHCNERNKDVESSKQNRTNGTTWNTAGSPTEAAVEDG